MNENQDLVTKKYLQESFKDFGETLMKIFVTKGELRDEMNKVRQEMKNMKQELKTDISVLEIKLSAEIKSSKESVLKDMHEMKNEILNSSDTIVKKLVTREAEEAATTNRMDRIETEHGARITTLEEKVFEN
ncbi:MAG: hypothetical protein A3F54_05550 [Candidatus Kerfeldbacteria bacterium RIFCSPHIGHO2_12_FULL_48_17]|uniref:Uncharacterized protein n=1 Tax=Candidatus Kerfeldbacteria bacterium RIFCSPHIGHO2_12_FULL_48_17 TaxID=1798542 RepID=A0A1G2B5X1_9BACT|nr:MAG: hypothetical protein A3F54_05550 [Candidatus Kerfeldbacteria bacterium RIFCSPHIGHO2_12_FULL_48_17]